MPNIGVNTTWGREDWSRYVLDHLSTASVLLRAGARLVPVRGRVAHIPRVLTDGTATWTPEGQEIASSAPTGDSLALTPRKVANVVALSSESIADAPVDELDAVGVALTRSVATAIDARAFSDAAATTTAPAGLRSYALPAQTGGVTLDNVVRAAGTVAAYGATANAVFVNPADLTDLRLVKETDASNKPVLTPDLTAAGAERIAGAIVYPTPTLPVGTAIVGDAAQIVVGIRQDIDVEFSSHAMFSADSIAARVTARIDWGTGDARGLVVIGE